MMRDWRMIRPAIAGGTGFLFDAFRRSGVTLKEFADYLAEDMGWGADQINRMFLRWYGISHDYSFPMALAGLDPSDPFHVRKYLLAQGTLEPAIEDILAAMPSVTLLRDAADAKTNPEQPAPAVTGFHDPIHDPAARRTEEFREVMGAPTVDAEEWLDSR